MNKHAFLILAHKDDDNFRALLSLLDNESNDLFIHMDIKNKSYKASEIELIAKHSKIYHTKRINVQWGSFSMVKAELELLSKATRTGHYEYYHLISGADLPIKSVKYIHNFFYENAGNEFVGIVKNDSTYRFRVNRYYFFQDKFGRDPDNTSKIWRKMDRYCHLIAKKFGFVRNEALDLCYGSQWFSITDNFARYVVSQKRWIKKHFNYTYIPDELFLQTLLNQSPFKGNVYKIENNSSFKSAMRLIDWKRGRPYIFCNNDFDELMSSEMIFARKFDSNANPDLTERILKTLGKENDNN